MAEVMRYLHELNIVTIAVRLVMAVVFGGIIGLERGRKLHPAGFRTHMLVCLGACLAILTNEYISRELGLTSDVTRMGAQVISGIGFLGAGTIIITRKQQVKGLTTAAGLWACACMGLAIGIGFYSGAFITLLLILLATTVLQRLEIFLLYSSKLVSLQVEFADHTALVEFIDFVKSQNIRITDMQTLKSREGSTTITVLVSLRLKNRIKHEVLMAEIETVSGVRLVRGAE